MKRVYQVLDLLLALFDLVLGLDLLLVQTLVAHAWRTLLILTVLRHQKCICSMVCV